MISRFDERKHHYYMKYSLGVFLLIIGILNLNFTFIYGKNNINLDPPTTPREQTTLFVCRMLLFCGLIINSLG